MADTTRKLRLTFINSEGGKFSQNWSNVKSNPGRSDTRSFMNTIVTNKTLFKTRPYDISAASLVTTTKTEFDLS